jgi:hypothetical protein
MLDLYLKRVTSCQNRSCLSHSAVSSSICRGTCWHNTAQRPQQQHTHLIQPAFAETSAEAALSRSA